MCSDHVTSLYPVTCADMLPRPMSFGWFEKFFTGFSFCLILIQITYKA